MTSQNVSETTRGIVARCFRCFKDYALVFAMLLGIGAYFVFHALPGHERYTPLAEQTLGWLQPALIALMLFVTFCKVRMSDLRFCPWHIGALLVQVVGFVLCALAAFYVRNAELQVVMQSGMLCWICPTATAAAVIASRLGAQPASLVSYTILSNTMASLLLPCAISLLHQSTDATQFWSAFSSMLWRVFPLLICPLLSAALLRHFLPAVSRRIEQLRNAAFYIWMVALSLAMVVSTRSFMHTQVSLLCLLGIASLSLFACLFQFYIGKRIGGHHGERICGGQALGQKNTVFMIWAGYTFLTPVTALAGGFYSIWHNVVNNRQLLQAQRLNGKP